MVSIIYAAVGVEFDIPVFITFIITITLLTYPPLFFAFSRTSKFILQCVHWHLDHDDIESAKKLAVSLAYQVWYREWKRNRWFRKFILDHNLHQASDRYARFSFKFET